MEKKYFTECVMDKLFDRFYMLDLIQQVFAKQFQKNYIVILHTLKIGFSTEYVLYMYMN